MTDPDISREVKDEALRLGFDAVGITDLAPTPHGPELRRWLEQGMAGTMQYLHRQESRRREPARILPGAIRAVVVTRNYYQPDSGTSPETGLVAKYARGADYHDVLRRPLEDLVAFIRAIGPAGTLTKAYVDAGPVPERELAQRAGIGWIGKNTMLIDPHRGSFMFLGTVLTSLPLRVDLPFEADRCGSCRRCLDACPTQAFPEARVLDARRCISYLTIEHVGGIAPDLANRMGTWVFGCDICQDVCPWNVSFAEETVDPTFRGEASLDLQELADASDREFEGRFAGTALTRPGPEGMRRNARIALDNRKGASCPTP